MKSFSSMLAWLLLAAVLAVPSFLFYNWWSKSKKQVSAEVTPEQVTVNVFPSDKGARPVPAAQPTELVSPSQPAPAARPAAQAAAQPAAQPAVQPAAQPASQPAQQPPSASAQPPETPPAAEQPPAEGVQAVETSTAVKPFSYYEPKGDRDPTYSPEDYRRIKEERMQREEAERMQRMANRKPQEPGPETRINLQGIVGSAAIINGDMYAVGQSVRGIRILKVGSDYIIAECVTGSCKGKKFRKVLK